MNHLSLILQLSSSTDLASTLIAVLFVLAICIGIFLLLRSIMLWYWKVYEIIENQEQQKKITEQQNRRHARANYYKSLTLGDNKQAYECLLYIIFHDLVDSKLDKESRKLKYESLKERYSKTFSNIGYDFPTYPF